MHWPAALHDVIHQHTLTHRSGRQSTRAAVYILILKRQIIPYAARGDFTAANRACDLIYYLLYKFSC